MGTAHLNIWLRGSDCVPLTDCWRADLVVKTCSGKYLVDFYPEIITQLIAKYPTYTISKLDNYQNYTRIHIQPPSGTFINHIEMDIPPGAYAVWCRVCHGKNEETNRVMVNPECGESRCVNLLLNAVQTCSEQLLHPAFDRVVNDGNFIEDMEIVPFMKLMMWSAYKGKAAVVAQLNERIIEAQEKGDTSLEARINAVLAIVNTLPDCQ